METLQINVKGWPQVYIDMLKDYAEQVSTKFRENGANFPKVPKELPKWPGIASVPPENLRREELYKDEDD